MKKNDVDSMFDYRYYYIDCTSIFDLPEGTIGSIEKQNVPLSDVIYKIH